MAVHKRFRLLICSWPMSLLHSLNFKEFLDFLHFFLFPLSPVCRQRHYTSPGILQTGGLFPPVCTVIHTCLIGGYLVEICVQLWTVVTTDERILGPSVNQSVIVSRSLSSAGLQRKLFPCCLFFCFLYRLSTNVHVCINSALGIQVTSQKCSFLDFQIICFYKTQRSCASTPFFSQHTSVSFNMSQLLESCARTRSRSRERKREREKTTPSNFILFEYVILISTLKNNERSVLDPKRTIEFSYLFLDYFNILALHLLIHSTIHPSLSEALLPSSGSRQGTP